MSDTSVMNYSKDRTDPTREYTIVGGPGSLESFVDKVNQFMQYGWVPLGAFVSLGQYGPYYQTMIRTQK